MQYAGLALDRSNAVCASRYFDPLWKLKKCFNMGAEAKVKEDVRVLDNFTHHLIQKRKKSIQDNDVRSKSNLLSKMLSMAKENSDLYDDRKLRDAVLNFVLAARDGTAVTLSWLLLLLSENLGVKNKIVQDFRIFRGSAAAPLRGMMFAASRNTLNC